MFADEVKSSEGQEIKQYLLTELENLKSITNIKGNSAEELALELKAQKKAYNMVSKILSTILTAEETHSQKGKSNEYSLRE